MFKPEYITLDVDKREDGKQLLKILRVLKIKGSYRLSSSKRGYHFLLNVKHHTKKENLMIRYMLGDCYGRFRCDVRRLQHGLKEMAILFDVKNGKRSGCWRKI